MKGYIVLGERGAPVSIGGIKIFKNKEDADKLLISLGRGLVTSILKIEEVEVIE